MKKIIYIVTLAAIFVGGTLMGASVDSATTNNTNLSLAALTTTTSALQENCTKTDRFWTESKVSYIQTCYNEDGFLCGYKTTCLPSEEGGPCQSVVCNNP